MLLGVTVEGGLILVALALGWLVGRSASERIGWSLNDLMLGVLAALPMLAAFWCSFRYPIGPLRGIKRFLMETAGPLFQHCTTLDLALVSLLAGLCEEMLFRGVLQEAFSGWVGPVMGVAAASVLFGLLHPITPLYTFLATLIGAYLGTVYILSGNLLPVIVAHGLYDFCALVYIVRSSTLKRV